MRTKRNYLMGCAVLLATAAAGTTAFADPVQLQAYTGAVGGSNECAGGGAPSALSFFSSGVGFGVGISGNGISDCGLAGSISNVVNPGMGAAPAVSATNLNNATYVNTGSGTYTGAASATANYGSLGVSASGSLTGTEPANGVAESVAMAITSDILDVNVNGGGTGFVEFQYTLNGGLSQSANDLAAGTLEAQVLLGSTSERAFYGIISEGAAGVFSATEGNVAGCAVGTDNFNCVNAVIATTMLPVTFGTATPFEAGLIVGTELLNGASSVDPSPGMSLTGIEVFDANGHPISNFSITSGSGASYGASGILGEPSTATPEPGMAWLLAIGLSLVLGVARVRQRKSLGGSVN